MQPTKEQLTTELTKLLQDCTKSELQALIDLVKVFPHKEKKWQTQESSQAEHTKQELQK